MKSPVLYLFAKQPRPGTVKTRLRPQCSARRAAGIAAHLVAATAERAAGAWGGEVVLCCWPDAQHPLFESLAARLGLRLCGQVEGDLGAKMHAALAGGVREHGAAAVMGCDVPQVSTDSLGLAYDELARGRNVLGLTLDGGFYFLGACTTSPGMFAGVDWEGGEVAARTVSAARESGIEFGVMLPTLQDIDTWDDLQRVAVLEPSLRVLCQ